MIKVVVGNNVKRETVLVDENCTVKALLEQKGIDYTSQAPTLDGCTLTPSELNKSFAENGITDKCFLLSVKKTDNA